MPTKIETQDGAVGKSLKTSYKKDKDTDTQLIICELNVQMPVDRREFDELAGLPHGYVDRFYTEEGAPFADVSMLFMRRQLQADGKLWRGEEQFTAALSIRKGTASNLRFKLEPNGATLICKLTWRAAGDEISHIEHLLAQWCAVAMTFDQPADKQEPLAFGDPASGPQGLAGRLAALDVEIPTDSDFWSKISPTNLSRLMEWVDEAENGDGETLDGEDPPHFVTAWLEGDGGAAAAGEPETEEAEAEA